MDGPGNSDTKDPQGEGSSNGRNGTNSPETTITPGDIKLPTGTEVNASSVADARKKIEARLSTAQGDERAALETQLASVSAMESQLKSQPAARDQFAFARREVGIKVEVLPEVSESLDAVQKLDTETLLRNPQLLSDLQGERGKSTQELAAGKVEAGVIAAEKQQAVTQAGADVKKQRESAQARFDKLRQQVMDEGKKGPIPKERVAQYRQQLQQLRSQITQETSQLEADLNQREEDTVSRQDRFNTLQARTQQAVEETVKRDVETGNFKKYSDRMYQDRGRRLSGGQDIISPGGSQRGIFSLMDPTRPGELLPSPPRNPSNLRFQDAGDGTFKVDLGPNGTVELRPADNASAVNPFRMVGPNPTPDPVSKNGLTLPDKADLGRTKLTLSDGRVMEVSAPEEITRQIQAERRMTDAGAAKMKSAYDTTLSPQAARTLSYASDILVAPKQDTQLTRSEFKAVDDQLAQEKQRIEARTRELEAIIQVAEEKGTADLAQLEAMRQEARTHQAVATAQIDQARQKLEGRITEAKTVETGFRDGSGQPIKVMEDATAEKVRGEFRAGAEQVVKMASNPQLAVSVKASMDRAVQNYGPEQVQRVMEAVRTGKDLSTVLPQGPQNAGARLELETLAQSMAALQGVDEARSRYVLSGASIVDKTQFTEFRNEQLLADKTRLVIDTNLLVTRAEMSAIQVQDFMKGQGILTKAGAFIVDGIAYDIDRQTFGNLREGGHLPDSRYELALHIKEKVDPVAASIRADVRALEKATTKEEVGRLYDRIQASQKLLEQHLQTASTISQGALGNAALAKNLAITGAAIGAGIFTGGTGTVAILSAAAAGTAIRAGAEIVDGATSEKGVNWNNVAKEGVMGVLDGVGGAAATRLAGFSTKLLSQSVKGLSPIARGAVHFGTHTLIEGGGSGALSGGVQAYMNGEDILKGAASGAMWGVLLDGTLRGAITGLSSRRGSVPDSVAPKLSQLPDGQGSSVTIDHAQLPEGRTPEALVRVVDTPNGPEATVRLDNGELATVKMPKPQPDVSPSATPAGKSPEPLADIPSGVKAKYEAKTLADMLAARALEAESGGPLVRDIDAYLAGKIADSATSIDDLRRIQSEVGSPELLEASRKQIADRVRQVQTVDGRPVLRDESQLSNADVAALADAQMRNFTPNEIENLINQFPEAKRPMATQLLSELTQFGNTQGMQALGYALRDQVGGGTLFYLPDNPGLVQTLNYLDSKGNFYLPANVKPLNLDAVNVRGHLVMDDAFVTRFQTDPKFQEFIRKNPQIKLINPSGLNSGISIFNQAALGTPAFTTRFNEMAGRVENLINANPGMDMNQAVQQVVNQQARQQLIEGFTELARRNGENLADPAVLRQIDQSVNNRLTEPLRVAPDRAATPASIAGQLNAQPLDEAALNRLFDDMHLSPEQRAAAREMMAQNMEVFSYRRMSELSRNIHTRVMDQARKSGVSPENVFYVINTVPKTPGKSFNLVTEMHLQTNGIPHTQVLTIPAGSPGFTLPPNIPPNAMFVVLDDLAGSGGSLVKVSDQIRATGFNGQVVLSPIAVTDGAAQRLQGLANTTVIAGEQLPSFTRSPFFQGIEGPGGTTPGIFHDLTGGQFGISSTVSQTNGGMPMGDGLNISFPYMGPNNNNFFFQNIAGMLAGDAHALKLPDAQTNMRIFINRLNRIYVPRQTGVHQ